MFFSCEEKKSPEQNINSDTIKSSQIPAKATDTFASETATKQADDPIANIRSKVKAINNANLQKKHYEFMCDEKMRVDYFYRNNEIVKIAIDFGTVGDVYAREDYYYDQGKLLFIYEFVEGGPACEGCIKRNEYRTYLADNKTIKYLKDKSETACKICEFSDSSRQYKLLDAKSQEDIKKILCP
jgi:hypothetical protein